MELIIGIIKAIMVIVFSLFGLIAAGCVGLALLLMLGWLITLFED